MTNISITFIQVYKIEDQLTPSEIKNLTVGGKLSTGFFKPFGKELLADCKVQVILWLLSLSTSPQFQYSFLSKSLFFFLISFSHLQSKGCLYKMYTFTLLHHQEKVNFLEPPFNS